MKIKKRLSILFGSFLLLVAVSYGAFSLYEDLTGDFRLVNIDFDMPHDFTLDVPIASEVKKEVDQLLKEKFTWLGHGHQVFAFKSRDSKYALKIFKFKRLKPSKIRQWMMHIPGLEAYAEKQEALRIRRLEKLFVGYHLGYMLDPEHTGLLFVHLNKTKGEFEHQVKVKDRLGISHHVDLDEAFFAIQELGKTTKATFDDLLSRGDVERVKFLIHQLFNMYLAEYQKGIVDMDHNIVHNTGFIGDRPIRLDLGQLHYSESIRHPHVYQEDLTKVFSKRLKGWILKYYPKYHAELSEEIDHELNKTT